ncbi:DUF2306 domain-containing protein [Flavihumibacter sp.]|uniref:DUF2306 domain-containing protein n=1 Tax=Flavihumibacter sp. TaxID=1913981 RepID=UPI003FA5F9AA
MGITIRIMTWVLWALIISLSVYFLFDNVIAYFFGYRSRLFGDSFFHNQVWVALHMGGGTLLLLSGPFQFWSWFRKEYLSIHRLLGKIYLIGAGLAGFSALRISLISTCLPCRISLFLLSVFMLLSSGLAWLSVKQRNIKAHKQFMVRSYVCALAFVTVRIDGILPLDFLFSNISDPIFRRTVNEYFFSFVPLIIAEIIMTWLPSVRRKRYQH